MTGIYREEALASRYIDLEQSNWPIEPRLHLIGLGLVLGAISILGYLLSVPVGRYAYVPGTLIQVSPSFDLKPNGPESQWVKNTLVIEVASDSLKNIKPGASVFVQQSRDGALNSGKIKEIVPESSRAVDSSQSKANVYAEFDSGQVAPGQQRTPLYLGQPLLLRVVLRRERLRNVIWAHARTP